jgi:hypothetical protein
MVSDGAVMTEDVNHLSVESGLGNDMGLVGYENPKLSRLFAQPMNGDAIQHIGYWDFVHQSGIGIQELPSLVLMQSVHCH